MKTTAIQMNVSLNFKQVLNIVQQLSPEEKQRLSEILWSERDVENITIPESDKQLVRQRIKKQEAASGSYLSWNEIEQKLNNR